jgi:small subunit ribosomal protein S3
MESGALGVEIIISGKLRTERARYEKFKDGYIPKSGEPALRQLHKAELHVQLKPGMFGIKVRIMPPDAQFPDQVQIIEETPPEATETPEKTEPTAKPEAIEAEEKEETAETAETAETTETATEPVKEEPKEPRK